MSTSKPKDNALWTWSELEQACGLSISGEKTGVNGISIDSRSVVLDDLFIALSGDPGPRFKSSGSQGLDGHDFIPSALQNGASGLMVSKPIDLPSDSDMNRLLVSDTLDGLWQIGAAGRARMTGKVVAITGSSGKTTLRQWVQEILSTQATTHASVGSFNNHWGVPLSLARMPRQSAYGVFEVGMNHPGEISPLTKLVKPDVAVVLNVLPAHIGQFESLEHIKKEKLSIADGLGPEGILVLPDDLVPGSAEHHQIVSFGFGNNASVRGRIVDAGQDRNVTKVEVTIDKQSYTYALDGKGEHRVLTSLAALAIAHALGADLHAATNSLGAITTPKGRGNQIRLGNTVLTDDSYNANPVSMAYALQSLRASSAETKIAILGEMFELGDGGADAHRAIQAQCSGLSRVLTVGDGFNVWQANALPRGVWQHYDNAEDIPIDQLGLGTDSQTELLVKGSNKVFWVNGFVGRLEKILREKLKR